MALDPRLLDQVLTTPESRDVLASPIVTAIILTDPANAADLVPALEPVGSIRAKNARRVLCMFGAAAVPSLLGSLGNASPETTKEAIEIMWAMLVGENKTTIREVMAQVGDDLDRLLADR